MLRYFESKEASAELLRLALPLMSQQEAALHPISYALWYEYVGGKNAKLRDAVDRALEKQKSLDEDAVLDLYSRFIADRDVAASARMHADLERMIAELLQNVATAGTQTSEFSDSLNQYGERLQAGVDRQSIDALLQSLLHATRRVNKSTASFQGQLKAGGQEVAALRAELIRARDEAHTDPLTGIKNRRGFEHAIHQAQAEGRGLDGACLVMIDIDHFKKCNDSYGHLFGDKVIRSVAQILSNEIKGQDTAARVGGEEFALLLPGTLIDGARTVAERIRKKVEGGRIKRIETGDMIGNITISLGAAAYRSGESFEEWAHRADEALYASKRAGRNCVTIAEDKSTATRPQQAVHP